LIFALLLCLWIDNATPKNVDEPSAGQCDFCEYYVVRMIFTGVVAKVDDNQITQTLARMCGANLPIYSQQCKDLLKVAPNMIADIKAGGSVRDQCSKANQCPAQSNSDNTGGKCDYCGFITQTVFQMVLRGEPTPNIIGMIGGICESVIDIYSQECNAILPNLIKIILEFKSGAGINEVCAKLSFCEDSKQQNVAVTTEGECDFCQYGVVTAFMMMLQGTSDNGIIQYASGLCPHVIPFYSKSCNTIVSNLPNILQALRAESGIRQECSKMNLCAASNSYGFRRRHAKDHY